jgi:PAS domain S-box-containing protein
VTAVQSPSASDRTLPPPRATADQAVRTALRASIVDSADDAIVSATLGGVITAWNPAAERMFGYSAAQIVGHSGTELTPTGRSVEMTEILERVRDGGRTVYYETTRRTKDGSAILVSVAVSPVRDSAGVIIGISSISHDISEREHARERARSAAQYARSLIEASRDPLVMISPEGKITDVNEATIRVTGADRDRLVGADFCDYFTEPDKAREVYREVFAEGFVTDYPLTIHHIDGTLTDVLYNASVYKDAADNVLGVFAAARDITAQKRAESQLAEQWAREHERLAELERFQKLTVGRELRMIELKKEIEELRTALPSTSP